MGWTIDGKYVSDDPIKEGLEKAHNFISEASGPTTALGAAYHTVKDFAENKKLWETAKEIAKVQGANAAGRAALGGAMAGTMSTLMKGYTIPLYAELLANGVNAAYGYYKDGTSKVNPYASAFGDSLMNLGLFEGMAQGLARKNPLLFAAFAGASALKGIREVDERRELEKDLIKEGTK